MVEAGCAEKHTTRKKLAKIDKLSMMRELFLLEGAQVHAWA
jgi:hypothetical protein